MTIRIWQAHDLFTSGKCGPDTKVVKLSDLRERLQKISNVRGNQERHRKFKQLVAELAPTAGIQEEKLPIGGALSRGSTKASSPPVEPAPKEKVTK